MSTSSTFSTLGGQTKRRFTPPPWIEHCSLYEVNVRQYTPEGTFAAFAKHLPRIKEMGVDVLWFMPVTPISVEKRQGTLGSYYAASEFTNTNSEFGTLEDFGAVVKEAHKLGLKVIIDWVANHTGCDHVWTRSKPHFYKKDAQGNFYDNHGWIDVIDLNYYDGEMRQCMIDSMSFWVKKFDIDGFRCDMAHLVPLDFWREARIKLDALKPLFWLAETEDGHYLDVFDCCYAWHWMHSTKSFIDGKLKLQDLRELLAKYEKDYPPETTHLFFTSNHDENSWNGTEYEKYGEAAKPFAVFSVLWNGIPLIYSGQELPNQKRLKFFEKDLIEWNEKPAMHDFYKRLLNLRKKHPAIVAARSKKPEIMKTNVDEYVFGFVRRKNNEDVLVLLNLSPNHLFVQLPEGYVYGEFKELFTDQEIEVIPGLSIEMHAWDYKVFTNHNK